MSAEEKIMKEVKNEKESKTRTETQCDRILAYMKENGSITQLDALRECGVMRLASRINDLKRKGVKITSKMENMTGRYGKFSVARYSIEEMHL